jgi:hypothetical protein
MDMRKSDIRKIIKEEVIQLIKEQYLTEAFADPKLAMINKLGGLDRRWRGTFWDAAAKTYDLAWDKLPKGTLQKKSVSDPSILKDGMMTFWIVKTEKPNIFRTGYASYNVRPGVLAVTLSGKIQYFNRGEGIGAKGSRDQEPVGKAERGQLMVKKLKELADETYTFSLGDFRGGTTALKAKRAELKLGKDTFQNAKAWKQANLKRYKDILDARVGSRDQVDAMVAKIVKMANEAVKTGMEITKMGPYDRLMTTVSGKEVPLQNVTDAMGRALGHYANYIRFANQAEKEKEQGFGSDYYSKQTKDVAGTIKKIMMAFEKGDGNNLNRY